MSQHKILTNIEKGKVLRAARKRLGWTQAQMAVELNLDSTYLSQLENGGRAVDEFYLEKVADLEKLNKVNAFKEEPPPYLTTGIVSRDSCIQYLERFLDTCDNPAKIGWVAIELREHFPLDKWDKERRGTRAEDPRTSSSKPLSGAGVLAKQAGASSKVDPEE